MTLEQATDLVAELAGEYGVNASVYEGYSGRGMFGRSVVGIILDSTGDLITLGYAAAELEIPIGDLPQRTDSLGLGVIIY